MIILFYLFINLFNGLMVSSSNQLESKIMESNILVEKLPKYDE
jgi:hypothetical protein